MIGQKRFHFLAPIKRYLAQFTAYAVHCPVAWQMVLHASNTRSAQTAAERSPAHGRNGGRLPGLLHKKAAFLLSHENKKTDINRVTTSLRPSLAG